MNWPCSTNGGERENIHLASLLIRASSFQVSGIVGLLRAKGNDITKLIEQDRQCTYKRNIEARSRNHCYLNFLCVCLWPYGPG